MGGRKPEGLEAQGRDWTSTRNIDLNIQSEPQWNGFANQIICEMPSQIQTWIQLRNCGKISKLLNFTKASYLAFLNICYFPIKNGSKTNLGHEMLAFMQWLI